MDFYFIKNLNKKNLVQNVGTLLNSLHEKLKENIHKYGIVPLKSIQKCSYILNFSLCMNAHFYHILNFCHIFGDISRFHNNHLAGL